MDYKEDSWGDQVEAGSNTSIVALRVVEGDKIEVSNLRQ
jgi:phosphotransferase system HPr-like phosphotransfer protein